MNIRTSEMTAKLANKINEFNEFNDNCFKCLANYLVSEKGDFKYDITFEICEYPTLVEDIEIYVFDTNKTYRFIIEDVTVFNNIFELTPDEVRFLLIKEGVNE